MAVPTLVARPYLDGVPPEIVEKIVGDLDLNSIRNLRLTSKVLEDHCSGPRFKSFLGRQKTDLTSSSLSQLTAIARHPRFGAAVNTVVVLVVVHDYSELDRMLSTKRRRVFEKQGVFSITTEPEATQEELVEAQQTREKLVAQQREQKELAQDDNAAHRLKIPLQSFRTLETLAVEGAVVQGLGGYVPPSSVREWHPMWIRASEVYTSVILAIALSGIAIDTLTIYSNSRRCSVPTFDVNETEDYVSLGPEGQHIKNLSLSVSTKVETDDRKIADARARLSEVERAYFNTGMGTNADLLSENDPDAMAEGNYPGVARLLKRMPNLERLDLHLYGTLKSGSNNYAKLFTHIADSIALPSLRRCRLRGLRVTEEALLRFLTAHPKITTLELGELHLISGAWAPIFAHLVNMPHLQQLHLSSIWGPKRLLSLEPREQAWKEDWKPSSGGWTRNKNFSYPCLDGTMVHTRTYSREDIHRERFQFAKGPEQRQMGSPFFMAWLETRRAEYGPP